MENRDDTAAKLAPAAIEARIRELRMGKLTVKTKPGADVTVQQTRHEFLFGTAIPNSVAESWTPNPLAKNDAEAMSDSDREKYLKILGENFNYAVHENALKWYECEKEEGAVDYSTADRIWELCHQRHITMRGHCIFWEKDQFVLPWQKQLDNDRLRATVKRRAMGVTGHFKGRIEEFDLNNEMINGDFFRRRLGYGIINEMAWMAKAGNPNAALFVNDYGVLVEGGWNTGSYLMQIENLLANGVPIDGIGCQAHAGTSLGLPMDPQHVQRTLDRLSKFGLPIKITECLFDVRDEQQQAEQLRTIFPLFFAHPSIEAILMWGFWEKPHWRPWSALWRTDWSITPQGEAYRDFVYSKWWTKASGKADSNGNFQTDAFFGNYTISSSGKTKQATLSKKDKTLAVSID